MRTTFWWLASTLALATLGCSGGGSSPVAPSAPAALPSTLSVGSTSASATLGSPSLQGDLATSALAIYTVRIDPVSLQATAALKETRTGQANDDLYLLPIDNFLRADSFQIVGIEGTTDTIDVTYAVEHPFPAPNNPTGTPNGSTNRSDLGVAGMVLVLADVASATGNTYFTDRVANTALIENADAYYAPGQLLTFIGNANTFPYMQLVDEAAGGTSSRTGVSNGGNVTGNFGSDGWTRSEYGPTNDGWTGYGVLHQGQTSRATLSLDKGELAAGLDLEVTIIAKYNDPRGGTTSAQKRANRLPPATADASLFAYRMPHGALDGAKIEALAADGTFEPNTISSSTLRFHVVDWDARATETTAADLSEDAAFDTVAVGESGTPTLDVCIPGVLGDATVTAAIATVVDDDSAYGGDAGQDSGHPNDALFYEELVTKAAGSGQTGGVYTGMVRVTDPESGLIVGLDGSLNPVTTPDPVTYQAFDVQFGSPNTPPTAAYACTTATVNSGGTVTIDVTSVVDPDGDAITVEVDWDNNGTFDVAGTINSPYPVNNLFTSPITYTYSGSPPDIRTVPCRISDGIAPVVDLLPSDTFEVVVGGWVYTTGTNDHLDQGNSVAVDSSGNVYIGGQYLGNCNFGGGSRACNSTTLGADIFVVKLAPNGAYLWDRVIGSTTTNYQDLLTTIQIDPAGNPVILMHWGGLLPLSQWGGPDLTSNGTVNVGNFDLALIRMSAATGGYLGHFRTNDTCNSTRYNGALHTASIDINAAGEIVYGGVAVGATGVEVMDYGAPTTPFNFTVAGQQQQFAVKFSAATNPVPIWLSTLGTGVAATGNKGASSGFFTPAGDVICAGLYTSGWDFGGGARTVNLGTGSDMFVTKRNGTTGAWIWDVTMGSPTNSAATEFPAGGDADGTNVYIGGQFNTSMQWPGGGPLDTAPASFDGFVLALNSSTGAFAWRRHYQDSDLANGGIVRDVRVSGTDIYAAGQFGGSCDFGGGPRTTIGSHLDAMLIKLTNTGTYTYDRVWGSSTVIPEIYFGLTADSAGNPIMTGVYGGTVDMDPGPGVVNRTAFIGNDVMCIKLRGDVGEF